MRELLEARYAAARAAADAAQKAYIDTRIDASKKVLDELLQKSLEERFDALVTHRHDLLLSDRRKLVRSVRERQPEKIVVSSKRSSKYDRWRSKLPYNAFRLSAGLTLLVIALGLAVVANSNTPMQMVELNISEKRVITEHWPDGQKKNLEVQPGEEFALVRFEGDDAVLRNWEVGTGYVEIRLRKAVLKER